MVIKSQGGADIPELQPDPAAPAAPAPAADATLTLLLPREFVERCARDNIPPEEVIRGFIGDLCELRTEFGGGYWTNGSDERMYCEQWFERRYAHLAD